jgi:hypothetical protein
LMQDLGACLRRILGDGGGIHRRTIAGEASQAGLGAEWP